eukprot:2600181-Pleurochrysis_carterae.AAC.1
MTLARKRSQQRTRITSMHAPTITRELVRPRAYARMHMLHLMGGNTRSSRVRFAPTRAWVKARAQPRSDSRQHARGRKHALKH